MATRDQMIEMVKRFYDSTDSYDCIYMPKIPLPWLHLRLSGVRIDFIRTEVVFFRPKVSRDTFC